MAEPADYRVVVFARPDDPADLREVLEAQWGLNKIDAGIAARHVPGLLQQSLTRAEAEQTAAAIREIGLQAVAVAEQDLPDTQHAETVHHVRCVKKGLEICNLEGEADRCWPWEQLRLVSLGRVPLEQTRHYITNSILRADPTPPDVYAETGEMHGCEAWLIFEPPLRVLHVDSEHMNYEYLGDEKSLSGTANFERLIADIVAHVPQAFLTPSARSHLAHGPLHEHDFDASEDLQRYTVTEYLLAREVHHRDASPS